MKQLIIMAALLMFGVAAHGGDFNIETTLTNEVIRIPVVTSGCVAIHPGDGRGYVAEIRHAHAGNLYLSTGAYTVLAASDVWYCDKEKYYPLYASQLYKIGPTEAPLYLVSSGTAHTFTILRKKRR